MSLTAVIRRFRTGTYKVFRTSEGEYDANGRIHRSPAIDVDVVSVDDLLDELEITAHGLQDGNGPYYLTTTVTLPPPTETLVPYWAIVVDDDHIRLAESYDDALLSNFIDLTGIGDGTLHIANYFLADLSIQPGAGGLKDEASGQYTEATYTVWSTVELKAREDNYEGDIIEYNGELHRVDSVDFFGILSNHWKATITRMKTP